MTEILQIIGLMLFSGLKFFFAPSTTLLSGYSYFETIAITTIGGILSTIAFFYFGEMLKMLFSKRRFFKKENKIFTRTSRRLARVKTKYGLIGLAILTPCVFSIPLGSLIAARYFDHDRRTLPFLITSIVLWSFLLTSITAFFE